MRKPFTLPQDRNTILNNGTITSGRYEIDIVSNGRIKKAPNLDMKEINWDTICVWDTCANPYAGTPLASVYQGCGWNFSK